MKVLVTGGAGFVGTNIVNALIDKCNITVIDNLDTGKLKNIHQNVKFINMDCSDEGLHSVVKDKYDVIIHVAGQASKERSFKDVFYDLNSNTKSTLNLLELSRALKCMRFIFISTVCVYGGGGGDSAVYKETSDINPESIYAIHKYTSEQYLSLYKKHYNIDFTIFRLFTCYGPHADLDDTSRGMVGIFLEQYLNKHKSSVIVKGSLDRFRDFIFVKDVANIIHDSIDNTKFFNEIINLGTGKKTTVGELIHVISSNKNLKKRNIIIEDECIGDMIGCVSDCRKLQEIYNDTFKFTDIETGISETIQFFLNQS